VVFRAVRAASGAAGHLHGPFNGLGAAEQRRAVEAILVLPEDIDLADGRQLLSAIAQISHRHAKLNFMNVEAVAAALVLDAMVLLSPAVAGGVLPSVLDVERVPWEPRDPFGDVGRGPASEPG
jgi:hypothetical protein